MANTDATSADVVFRPKPSQPPPPNTVGLTGWLRKNLFGGPVDTLITIVCAYIIYVVVANVVEWAFVNAIWEAETRRDCIDQLKEAGLEGTAGACWAGVSDWMKNFMYGRYAAEEVWRIDLAGLIAVLWALPLWLPRVTGKTAIGMSFVMIYPFLAGYLFAGGEFSVFFQILLSVSIATLVWNTAHSVCCMASGRPLWDWVVGLSGFTAKDDRQHKYPVIAVFAAFTIVAFLLQSGWELKEMTTNNWGGLFLTLVISGIGIAVSLPAGIVLALGRRSSMPIIRVFCVTFIELFRSVPLITVLFMAVTMVPLFLPEGMNPVKLIQAIIAVCIFSSAYMAETVRGGLQALNKGQYEAADALGLSYWQTMAFIIMPQALKMMIPNIVGSFQGLMKDTTLVSIIGLYDLLLMLKAVSQGPQWNGLHTEPLVFGATIFFVLCFVMSKYSQHLERTLGQGSINK